MTGKTSALIMGVGPEQGLGAALCKRFAKENMQVFVCGRTTEKVEHIAELINSTGDHAQAITADLTKETDISTMIDVVNGSGLPLEVALNLMLQQGDATPKRSLLFTGASGSLRGKANFAAFAAGKGALRMLAQSLAREFGPQGIHIAHVIIDGVINGDKVVKGYPDFVAGLGEDGLLDIHAIAENFWTLHSQERSAWTQEIDLRPFKENF